MESGHLFCFGLGYSATALTRALRLRRWLVTGTTRAGEQSEALISSEVPIYLYDGSAPLDNFTAYLEGVSHLLISTPPNADGDPVLRQHHRDLEQLKSLKWLGYLSTTGVYGDHDGDWVDEQTPLNPSNTRSQYRQAAEEAWLSLWRHHGLPVHIFRLAGIYGPGRNAFVTLKSGQARRIVKPGQVFSRIHVDDLAQTLMQSFARPSPGAVYNVCDDEAAPPQDVIKYATGLLGLEAPPEIPFDDAQLSEMARSFYTDNKKVKNDRIKDELGVRLKYPSYREGLAACFERLDA